MFSAKYSKENERVRLQLKGGGVVDPESGLDSVAHVYKDKDGTLYSAVLGQVDIQRDKNSFYKLQVLQSDKGRFNLLLLLLLDTFSEILL